MSTSRTGASPPSRGPARPRKRGPVRFAPSRTARGLAAGEMGLGLDAAEVADLVAQVRAGGGQPIAAYREPLAGRPLVLATLPLAALAPTPFQRDISPPHVNRLAARIEDSGAFLDPIIVVRGPEGALWTPNGRHRLAAAKVLGLRQITALVAADETLAFRILALNTEKAHNLRDRALEVIRMARELARRDPRSPEAKHEAAFEEPALLTLGLCYEREGRFPGSAYAPVLRRLERFLPDPLPKALRRREDRAARLREIDREVAQRIAELRARGFRSPYLRTLIVARIDPARPAGPGRRARTSTMEIGEALTRMLAAARRFDTSRVRESDLALVAAVAPSPDES